MQEENSKNKQSDEYSLMMLLERLETLREDLDEAGFSSLQEIEAALAITASGSNGSSAIDPELEARRNHLMEIRDELLDLDIDSYSEINDQIRTINTQLDGTDED